MKTGLESGMAPGWGAIERERRFDRWVRGICAGAWGVTFLLTLCYTALVVPQVLDALRRQQVGAASASTVLDAVMPLVIALGILAILVAVLSTVAVFLRFRTAALAEIQMRLAALEGMLTGGEGSAPARTPGG